VPKLVNETATPKRISSNARKLKRHFLLCDHVVKYLILNSAEQSLFRSIRFRVLILETRRIFSWYENRNVKGKLKEKWTISASNLKMAATICSGPWAVKQSTSKRSVNQYHDK